jgi:hypothetical protein
VAELGVDDRARRPNRWCSIDYLRQQLLRICNKLTSRSVMYESASKSFRTQSISKYTPTFGTSRWEAIQRVMAAKLTRLTHKIAIQLHLVAESCIICSSRSRWPVRKLLDTPTYVTFQSTRLEKACPLNWSTPFCFNSVRASLQT